MADVGSAIIARLRADDAWWGRVGGRVDWGVSLPETACPRVVLTFVGGVQPDMADGPDMQEARLQVDTYSTQSAAEAADIEGQALDILRQEDDAGGIRFTRSPDVDFPTDGGEQTPTGFQHRSRADIMLVCAPIA